MTSIQIAQTTIGTTEQTSAIVEKFLSKEQYLTIKATWAATKEHTSADIIIYNVLRSFSPSRGFTPLTDRKVTSRSNDKWDGFNKALYAAKQKTDPYRRSRFNDADYTDSLTVAMTAFKTTFGIDLTDDIKAAIKAIEGLK